MSKDLDMRMKPYACVATGVNENMEGVGMIEVVLHSDTINNIQRVFFFFWNNTIRNGGEKEKDQRNEKIVHTVHN